MKEHCQEESILRAGLYRGLPVQTLKLSVYEDRETNVCLYSRDSPCTKVKMASHQEGAEHLGSTSDPRFKAGSVHSDCGAWLCARKKAVFLRHGGCMPKRQKGQTGDAPRTQIWDSLKI